MTTNELRACPFCGKKRHLRFEPFEGSTDTGIVVCICGASYTTIEQGLDDWNTRPIEDALRKRIAELESAQRWIPVSEPPIITHYNDAVSAGKVSVDVKTSTDNNNRSKWKAYVPGWGAPTVNKRYLVKLINDWITIATYYLHVGGGYWKDDRGQELADGVVSLWKGLEE